MRLIDVDALWAQMKEYLEKRIEEANMTGDRAVCVTWHDAVILIKNAPTVDAVPVIRCKDCKHWDGYYCHHKGYGNGYANYSPPIKSGEGFCDWAERKEK